MLFSCDYAETTIIIIITSRGDSHFKNSFRDQIQKRRVRQMLNQIILRPKVFSCLFYENQRQKLVKLKKRRRAAVSMLHTVCYYILQNFCLCSEKLIIRLKKRFKHECSKNQQQRLIQHMRGNFSMIQSIFFDFRKN